MFWLVNGATLGNTVGDVAVPVVSNFPTHIPFSVVSPNVKLGCILYPSLADLFVEFIKFTFISPGKSFVPAVPSICVPYCPSIFYSYLGIHTNIPCTSVDTSTVSPTFFVTSSFNTTAFAHS